MPMVRHGHARLGSWHEPTAHFLARIKGALRRAMLFSRYDLIFSNVRDLVVKDLELYLGA
jgi:hypothetical protein